MAKKMARKGRTKVIYKGTFVSIQTLFLSITGKGKFDYISLSTLYTTMHTYMILSGGLKFNVQILTYALFI